MPARRGVEVVGSTGVLRVANPWHPLPDGIELLQDHAGAGETIPMPAADPYALEVADLCAAIRGEREPLLGRADAAGQARTIEALYAAAQTGQSVTL
jgi:predicted dehydrogenase